MQKYKKQSINWKTLLITLIAFALLVLSVSSSWAASPRLEVSVSGNDVTLGDVFEGVIENSDHVLAPAPMPGKTLTLGAYDLGRISKAFNLDWRPVSLKEQVVVKRTATVVSHHKIVNELQASVSQALLERSVEIEPVSRNLSFVLPGEFSDAVEIRDIHIDENRGMFNATVIAPAGSENPDVSKYVTGRFFRVVQVPVLSQRMRKGDIIGKHDIQYLPLRESSLNQSFVMDVEDLVGQTPRRGVAALKPIIVGDVHAPLVVNKGDLVTMVLNKKGISLTAQGKAIDNGAQGGIVRIMNINSHKIVEAEVTGAQKVRVITALEKS